MSQTMPGPEKIPFGQTTAARAAAVALALAVSLFLAAFLVATLPERNTGWEKTLPTPAMSETEAEAALLRAKYLHEAEIRPQLIQAGFFSPDDAAEPHDRRRGRHNEEFSSKALTNALWAFRAFPVLHKEFLPMLLAPETEPGERVREFRLYGGFLAALADNIVDGQNSCYDAFGHAEDSLDEAADWFAYFVNDPRVKITSLQDSRRKSPTPEETSASRKLFEERLTFARSVLPVIFDGLKQDLEARTALAAGKKSSGNEAWDGSHGRDGYLADLHHAMTEGLLILWKKRADPGFAALARGIVESREVPLRTRYSLLSLAAERPGLPVSEYFFWQQYRDDLNSVTSCVGTTPAHYAYLLGRTDKLTPETADRLKARGTFILSEHTGPGVTMTRTETITPRRNLSGNLYLLVDMDLVLDNANRPENNKIPEYDLSRATPIFQGTLYRHMERQPLVLPLNPTAPGDAALIEWYAKTGWEEGRSLLFSAVGSAGNAARHWASLHLLWWGDSDPEKDDEVYLAYLHPESGHFMLGMLPELKGKAVPRFFGPITALWFGVQNVDANGWTEEKYEARPQTPPVLPRIPRTPLRSPILEWFTGEKPEPAKMAPFPSEETATLLVDGSIRSSLSKTFTRNERIHLALDLDKQYHDPAMPPEGLFTFVATTCDELDNWGIEDENHVAQALEYLWRFRADEALDARVRGVLSQEDLQPDERMRKIRRVLGLTEKGEN